MAPPKHFLHCPFTKFLCLPPLPFSSWHPFKTPKVYHTHLIIILVIFLLVLNLLWWRLLALIFQIDVKCFGECNGRQHTHHWGQGQHQTDHHTSKIDCTDGIQNDWKRSRHQNDHISAQCSNRVVTVLCSNRMCTKSFFSDTALLQDAKYTWYAFNHTHIFPRLFPRRKERHHWKSFQCEIFMEKLAFFYSINVPAWRPIRNTQRWSTRKFLDGGTICTYWRPFRHWFPWSWTMLQLGTHRLGCVSQRRRRPMLWVDALILRL